MNALILLVLTGILILKLRHSHKRYECIPDFSAPFCQQVINPMDPANYRRLSLAKHIRDLGHTSLCNSPCEVICEESKVVPFFLHKNITRSDSLNNAKSPHYIEGRTQQLTPP